MTSFLPFLPKAKLFWFMFKKRGLSVRGSFTKHKKTSFSSFYSHPDFLWLLFWSHLSPDSELTSKMGPYDPIGADCVFSLPHLPQRTLYHCGSILPPVSFALALVPTPGFCVIRTQSWWHWSAPSLLGNMGQGEGGNGLVSTLLRGRDKERGIRYSSANDFLSCFKEWLGVNLKRNLRFLPTCLLFFFLCVYVPKGDAGLSLNCKTGLALRSVITWMMLSSQRPPGIHLLWRKVWIYQFVPVGATLLHG